MDDESSKILLGGLMAGVVGVVGFVWKRVTGAASRAELKSAIESCNATYSTALADSNRHLEKSIEIASLDRKEIRNRVVELFKAGEGDRRRSEERFTILTKTVTDQHSVIVDKIDASAREVKDDLRNELRNGKR